MLSRLAPLSLLFVAVAAVAHDVNVTASIQDVSLEVVSKYGIKPGDEVHSAFDKAARLELSVSAEEATNGTQLGYYDFGYGTMADKSSAASFRQTYGDVAGFLKGRATTKYIEAKFGNLTLPMGDSDLFLVASEEDAAVIGKMGFPWNMVEVFVLQNYSYARPDAFRLTHSFVGRSSYVEVLDEAAFDALMQGITKDAETRSPGVIGHAVSYYHYNPGPLHPFKKKKVFAHLREAFASPLAAKLHFDSLAANDKWGLNQYSTIQWIRTYASADQMAAMQTVTPASPANEFYTLSGLGVTPMVWAH